MDVQLDAGQQRFVDGVAEHSHPVVCMNVAGGGKCLGRGTIVLMHDGILRPVEEILPGDALMGPDGRMRIVQSLTHGIGPLYKITPVKGSPWICNDAHIMTMKSWRYGVRDIPLKDLLDSCNVERPDKEWKLFRTGVDFELWEDVPIAVPPYLAGLWFGDGSKGTTNITNPDEEIISYLQHIAPQLGMRAVVCYSKQKCPLVRLSLEVLKHNHPVRKTLLCDFVVDGEKRIPDEYLLNSRYNRLELLAGLLDTDGYYHHGHYEIVSQYPKLAEQIAFLARSLGFAAYIRDKRVVYKGEQRTYSRITISGNVSEIPCKVNRKKASPRKQVKDVLNTGWTAEAIGEGEYFGFELDGDGRFLLGDFTVTHNSTTLTHTYHALLHKFEARDILVACYNNHNKDDLISRLPEFAKKNIKTYHSLAWWAVLGAYQIPMRAWDWEPRKYLYLITHFAQRYYGEVALTPEQAQIVEDTETLRAMCHNTLTNPSQWERVMALADDYCIPVDEAFAQACLPIVFEWGRKGLESPLMGSYWSIKEKYDQSENLYLAATEPGARFWKYRVVLTDERQDCNEAQAALLNRTLRRDGYCHSVGDPDQQLYLFAGSDIEGWNKVVSQQDAELVNSPISYRCSKAVVELAKNYVSRIEAWSGAKEGKVEYVKRESMLRGMEPGHVFLSKTNADAIQTALRCIAAGKQARVKGRDIGRQMETLLDTLSARKGYHYDCLLTILHEWRNQQIAILMRKYLDAEREIENIIDRAKSMEALYLAALHEGVGNDTAFRVYIDRLFSDEKDTREIVLCSTIHKFKGFQAENVWIQETDLQPGKKASTPREVKQEWNAAYVAITRSQDSIYLVKDTGYYAA